MSVCVCVCVCVEELRLLTHTEEKEETAVSSLMTTSDVLFLACAVSAVRVRFCFLCHILT